MLDGTQLTLLLQQARHRPLLTEFEQYMMSAGEKLWSSESTEDRELESRSLIRLIEWLVTKDTTVSTEGVAITPGDVGPSSSAVTEEVATTPGDVRPSSSPAVTDEVATTPGDVRPSSSPAVQDQEQCGQQTTSTSDAKHCVSPGDDCDSDHHPHDGDGGCDDNHEGNGDDIDIDMNQAERDSDYVGSDEESTKNQNKYPPPPSPAHPDINRVLESAAEAVFFLVFVFFEVYFYFIFFLFTFFKQRQPSILIRLIQMTNSSKHYYTMPMFLF